MAAWLSASDSFPAPTCPGHIGTGSRHFPPVAQMQPVRGHRVILPPLGREVGQAPFHERSRYQPFAVPAPSPVSLVRAWPAVLPLTPPAFALAQIRDWRSSGEW